jgi:uncharacterized protein YjhX (UPF0386 family)
MAKPIDGIIEAVRYKNGQIVVVRAYERRGKTYSDCVLLDRKTLLERVQKGQQYVVGSREEFRASTFKTGKSVKVAKQGDREFLATRQDISRDELEEAPLF